MNLFGRKRKGGVEAPRKIERLAWDPKYSVRIEKIDAQHRELFAVMNRIADLHESGSNDLFPILQDLVQYAAEHFRAEEMVMMQVKYYGFKDQSDQHGQFMEKVQGFLSAYKEQDDRLTHRMLIYIHDWLLKHTTQADMQYADFLVRSGSLPALRGEA